MFGDGEDGKVINVVQKGYKLGDRVLRPAMVMVGKGRQTSWKVETMPLFGGSKRPKLDGLTKDEEKRRDALNPEVLRRAGEKRRRGAGAGRGGILREKADGAAEYLWPLLLGWQQMSLRRYALAIEAFGEVIGRDNKEIRAHYGAGAAYFQAAEAKQNLGAGGYRRGGPAGMTVDNLYHESARNFRKALELATEKSERDELQNAVAAWSGRCHARRGDCNRWSPTSNRTISNTER